jgi:hypothetical protein
MRIDREKPPFDVPCCIEVIGDVHRDASNPRRNRMSRMVGLHLRERRLVRHGALKLLQMFWGPTNSHTLLVVAEAHHNIWQRATFHIILRCPRDYRRIKNSWLS